MFFARFLHVQFVLYSGGNIMYVMKCATWFKQDLAATLHFMIINKNRMGSKSDIAG